MEKEPKIEKKPTLKYEKPLVVDLAPERASGSYGCNPVGSVTGGMTQIYYDPVGGNPFVG